LGDGVASEVAFLTTLASTRLPGVEDVDVALIHQKKRARWIMVSLAVTSKRLQDGLP